MNKNIALVTLGCCKNEVDSELILGYLTSKGFKLTADLDSANVIIINTCGFIESAKSEAIDTILDMIEYKTNGNCESIIVVGCLAKRYKNEIIKELPEVDLVIGVDEYKNIDKIFSDYFNLRHSNLTLDFQNRVISTKFPTAYLRIADGCNNNCTYCAIPIIRGGLKSRKLEDIIEEARLLVSKGIQELVVIAQDTTSYGVDIYGKPMLCSLLKDLSKLDVKWIRILYMYPGKVDDELLLEMKNNSKVCKYFDLPIQHISNDMLSKMNRHTNKQEIYDLILKIRQLIPDAIIRTTVMLGFPGETKKDFEELKQAIIDFKFDRLGAFTYSPEDDTKAGIMPDQIDEITKTNRFNEIMELQQRILQETMDKNIGRKVTVLVQDVSKDERYFECRSYMDAPDVDPKIYVPINETTKNMIISGFYDVTISNVLGYDYVATYSEEKEIEYV